LHLQHDAVLHGDPATPPQFARIFVEAWHCVGRIFVEAFHCVMFHPDIRGVIGGLLCQKKNGAIGLLLCQKKD